MDTSMIIYHRRPEMARQLADELLGKHLMSDAPNGLFLAAAHRQVQFPAIRA